MLHAADSEPEVSASALAAACTRWPRQFAGLADSSGASGSSKQRDELMAGLRKTRPVLVRGYESMVMARLLLEEGPGCAEAILQDWGPLLQASLARCANLCDVRCAGQQQQQHLQQHRTARGDHHHHSTSTPACLPPLLLLLLMLRVQVGRGLAGAAGAV